MYAQDLGYDNYLDYLNSNDFWQRVRYPVTDARKVCEACTGTYNLMVHHGTYERLGSERMTDVFLVCGDCHQKIHDLEDTGVELMDATYRILEEGRQRQKELRDSAKVKEMVGW